MCGALFAVVLFGECTVRACVARARAVRASLVKFVKRKIFFKFVLQNEGV